mgnify:CR=1 FL=1
MSRLPQLLKLHAADPADADVPYMIALEHAKQGQVDEALAWLDKTLAIKPTYCYAYFQKGKLLSEIGRDAQAKAVIEAGIAAAGRCGDAHARDELTALLESVDSA